MGRLKQATPKLGKHRENIEGKKEMHIWKK
jgi:hypothetical protein